MNGFVDETNSSLSHVLVISDDTVSKVPTIETLQSLDTDGREPVFPLPKNC